MIKWFRNKLIEIVKEVLRERVQIQFAKVKNGATIPSKRDEDAGLDIYACFEEDYIVIKSLETVMIPTGIASIIPIEYVAILKERGSTGTKGIGQRSGVIDSGYRGEWLVPLTNHNDKHLVILKNEEKKEEVLKHYGEDVIIYPYIKAISQAVIVAVPLIEVVEVTHNDILENKSARGTGKVGSSGK